MPSLNQGSYLEAAIRSVLNQDYKGLELIVIDGGSTDKSIEIINKYAGRLKYWISEKDRGQSDAINKGLSKASGEIVTWLNSDDRYRPGTLTVVANHFANAPDTALFHGRAWLFGQRLFPVLIGPKQPIPQHLYLPYMRFPQPSSFFARHAIGQTLNPELHYAMDFELVVRNVLLGRKPAQTNAVLADYRLHKKSKTNDEKLFLKEWTGVLLNAFESADNGSKYSEKLGGIAGDSRDAPATYSCSVNFNESQLSEVLLEHLNLRFHFHYRRGEMPECEKIFSAINDEDPSYAKKGNFKLYLDRLSKYPLLLKLRRKFLP